MRGTDPIKSTWVYPKLMCKIAFLFCSLINKARPYLLLIFSLFLDKKLSNSITNLFKLEFFFNEVRFSLYINIEVIKVF